MWGCRAHLMLVYVWCTCVGSLPVVCYNSRCNRWRKHLHRPSNTTPIAHMQQPRPPQRRCFVSVFCFSCFLCVCRVRVAELSESADVSRAANQKLETKLSKADHYRQKVSTAHNTGTQHCNTPANTQHAPRRTCTSTRSAVVLT